ncbi:MAG: hypothetical protein AAB575_05950 [Patescibacteria group bacterium]
MKEISEKAIDQADNSFELGKNFDKLNEAEVAGSIVTAKLFESGQAGEETVVKKIKEIKTGHLKDSALFRIAKLYYEHKNDLQTALNTANEIQSQDERARCLVQLAVAVIHKEGNPESADKIIEQITEDNKEYKNYYEKVKKEYLGKQMK